MDYPDDNPDDDGDVPTYDELLKEFTQTLAEKDEEISALTREVADLKKKTKKSGSAGGDSTYYEQQNRELRQEKEEITAELAKLRGDLGAASVKVDGLMKEKAELDNRIRTQSKRIDELQRDNDNLTRKSQAVEEKNKEVTKQKSENNKAAQSWAQDNSRLSDENKDLEASLKAAGIRIVELEKALSDLDELKRIAEAQRDNLQVERDQLHDEIDELNSVRIEMNDKVEAANADADRHEKAAAALRDEMTKQQAKMKADVAQAKADTDRLQKQITALQDSTQTGKMAKEVEKLKKELNDNSEGIHQLDDLIKKLKQERDQLAAQVAKYEKGIDQEVANKLAGQQERMRVLDATLERLKQEKVSDAEHCKQLEDEKRALVKQVDELTHWKTVYENGHGLQQLSRTERKLTEDLKRLSRAYEEQGIAMSKEQQSREVVSLAFDRLKKECGKPANFTYPELELHKEVESTVSLLNAQVADFEKQIDMLEEENTRLRKTLRSQAGTVTDGNFKYPGMDADMLMKVNEFAANIREGKLELPVNDRTRVLMEENRQLKADLKTLNSQLLNFERNGYPSSNIGSDSVVNDHFGADMRSLVNDNAEMYKKLTGLEMQLDALVRNQPDTAAVKASDISAILNQNNELILREMEELRRSQQNYVAPPTGRFEPRVPPSGRFHTAQTPTDSVGQGKEPGSVVKGGQRGKLTLDLTPARHQSGEPGLQRAHASYATLPAGPAATPYWTPQIARGGMPFATPGPATPHGKQLLNNTIYNMNLPPEDWAMDVRELNTQLIECLEQLYEREQELSSQKELVSNYEENLAEIKTQMIVLYHDYAENSKKWEAKEKQLVDEHKAMNAERDDLKLKLKRTEDMASLLQKQDKEAIEWKATELTRKVTIYEANEAILSRKYTSLHEQLETETKKRIQLEIDFSEMEASLKQRVLFLEQYKLAAGSRLAFVQGKLDGSVPQADYLSLQSEMESLREDHLIALRREVEARAAALKALDRARELRSVRLVLAHQQEDLEKSRAQILNLEAELLHQREITDQAVAAVQSSAEVARLITELAKYRGEASRLEVELLGSNRRAELLTGSLDEVTREVEQLSARVKELEVREEQYSMREREARKALISYKLQYEGGLSRDEKDAMMLKTEKLEQGLGEAQREMLRLKELADISASQAQTLTQYRQVREEEIKELREYCTRLESRSEDEVLIGRLQRQLMSTKTSYKAFVRKYQHAREDVRTREIALRIVESRLADQEKTYHDLSTARRKEIISLKQALRNVRETIIETLPVGPSNLPIQRDIVSDSIKDAAALKVAAMSRALTRGSKLVTSAMSARVVEISGKVDHLEELAQNAVTQAAQKEEECRRLMGEVEELQAERSILQARLNDLNTIFHGAAGKQKTLATTLITHSEDILAIKRNDLKQRRQIQTMREETKHLRTLISKMETDMIELERSKVNSEASEFFATHVEGKGGRSILDTLDDDPLDAEILKSMSKTPLPPVHFNDSDAEHDENVDPQLMAELKAQVMTSHKQTSDLNLQVNNLSGKLQELDGLLAEKESQLNYYERVMTEQGLGGVVLRQQQLRQSVNKSQQKNSSMSAVEQEKLQAAATATISSLRALLEEKNRLIAKYQENNMTQGAGHRKSRGDVRAENILKLTEGELGQGQKGSTMIEMPMSDGGKANEAYKRLSVQLEHADSIIGDKDKTITQLEHNLSMQTNQRERAELRCGEALAEMDAMKADLMTLAAKLQESEARCSHLARANPSSIKVVGPEVNPNAISSAKTKQLSSLVKAKDEKIKKYRELIVLLKEEFMKGEQEKATAELKMRNKQDNSAAITPEELRDMKSQISALDEGLHRAHNDLEKVRTSREKVIKERNAALDDLKKMEEELAKSESKLTHANQMAQRLTRELEDARRTGVRLKEKVKEFVNADQGTSTNIGGKDKLTQAANRIEQLQREMDLLKAQNAALRRADAVDALVTRDVRGGASASVTGDRADSTSPSRGHTLGGGATGGPDDVRQQLHSKWENEKKLQKKVITLEARLQEKLTENEELQVQLQKCKESLQHALSAKEEIQKKAHSANRQADSRKFTAEEVMELEAAHAQIYTLQQQLQEMTRKADVEMVNQIRSLSHELSVSQTRAMEMERQLGEVEERRKKASSATTGGRNLRDSEDRFMMQERLKDELDFAKRAKQELEAALLDRDTRALEIKFDLESAEGDVVRLKSRVNQLEQVKRSLEAVIRSGGGGSSGAGRGAQNIPSNLTGAGGVLGSSNKNASKRELELEGAIEAMKKLVDRQQAEISRLNRGVPAAVAEPGRTAPADLEKKYQVEKKRAKDLEEELRVATEKLKVSEQNSQTTVAAKQQVANLRKQLKTKEDELAALRDDVGGHVMEKDALKMRSKQLEERLQALEVAAQQVHRTPAASASSQADVEAMRRLVSTQKAELDVTKAELEDLRRRQRDHASGQSSLNAQQMKALQEDNARLTKELSAFDDQFWQELEDLKYNHQKALERLKVYEGGGRRGMY